MMKNARISLLLCLLCFIPDSIFGQDEENLITINGIFDNIHDRFGTSYSAQDLIIKPEQPSGFSVNRGGTPIALDGPCTAGNDFELYFELGSGFHSLDTQVNGLPVNGPANQVIACRVFQQISAFLNTGCDANSGAHRVRIWFRPLEDVLDANDLTPDPIPDIEAAGPFTPLAVGSSFYELLSVSDPDYGGIVDGLVWQNLQTGRDPWGTFTTPIFSTGGQLQNAAPDLFHGFIAYNFYRSDLPAVYNGIADSAPFNELDLFATLLHEATHTLGFNSLVGPDGNSVFGTTYNYFSRYDLQIRNYDATLPFLAHTPGGMVNCAMYDFQYALSPSDLGPFNALDPLQNGLDDPCPFFPPVAQPGIANNLYCPGVPVIQTMGLNNKLYAPNCFEGGSSLSHVSNDCNYPKNFVMNHQALFGQDAARSYSDEERMILCQLGYVVLASFGETATGNFITYTQSCNSIAIGGVNDGYINGVFNITSVGPGSITVANILANDFGATGYTCVEVVVGDGTPVVSYDSNGIATASSFQYTANNDGLHVLRYTPINGAGDLGNITYIFISVYGANCTPNGCSIVSNGGFEEPVAPPGQTITTQANCWMSLSGFPIQRINRFDALECPTSNLCNGYPSNGRRTGSCTYGHLPPSEVFDIAQINTNHSFQLLYANVTPNNVYRSQVQQNFLSSPLIPATHYRISFRAKVINADYVNGTFQGAIPVRFATMEEFFPNNIGVGNLTTDPEPIIEANNGGLDVWPIESFLVPDEVGTISNTTCAYTLAQQANDWHTFSYEFEFQGSVSHGALLMWVDNLVTPPSTQPPGDGAYIFIEDVSIVPVDQASIDLPENVCFGQAPLLLQGTPTGGVFTGAGVTTVVNGNITEYFFDQSLVAPGITEVTITYTVMNSNLNPNCLDISVIDVIHLFNSQPPTITANILNNATCPGVADGSVAIASSGGTAPLVNSVFPNLPLSALSAGNYQALVVDANGCQATDLFTITNLAPQCCQLTIALDSQVEDGPCAQGGSGAASVTVSGGQLPYIYAWVGPNNATSNVEDPTNLEAGTWTLTVNSAGGCAPATLTVTINNVGWNALPNFNPTLGNDVVNLPAGTYYINQNWVIPTGTTLNINNSTLLFEQGFGITVYKNAFLNINNSNLTHACPDGFWAGIFVWGSSTWAETNDTNSGQSKITTTGTCEISYAYTGCQISNSGATGSAWRGAECSFSGTKFLNNIYQDISLNQFSLMRTLEFTNCQFVVDANYIGNMDPQQRHSVRMDKCWGALFTNCTWQYLCDNTTNFGMQFKNAINGSGTLTMDNCHIEGYWTGVNLTMPTNVLVGADNNPLQGLTLAEANRVRIYDCDIASYRGINLIGFIGKTVQIHNNTLRDMQSLGNVAINNTLTMSRTNPQGNVASPPSLASLNAITTPDTQNQGTQTYAIRLKTCTEYEVFENTVNQNSASIATPLLANRMGVYIDDCGPNNILEFTQNTVENCFAALVYRNDNREPAGFGLYTGAKFRCNDLENNKLDVYIMSDAQSSALIPEHGVDPNLGFAAESFKNPMNINPSNPINDIAVEMQVYNGALHHSYRYNFDTSELNPALCSNIGTPIVFLDADCPSLPSLLLGNNLTDLQLERAAHKINIENISTEIQTVMDGGSTQYLEDQIIYTNYQNAIQTYYALVENSPNLSESVLMQALDQYALPNALLVEILASNPQAAKSNEVLDKVNNRMIPFTEYQKQMIMNGQNLTSYLESLRNEMKDEMRMSKMKLIRMKNLILANNSIQDKYSALENLYAEEWQKEDLMLRVTNQFHAGNLAQAEALVDQWPNYYNATTDELQLMHDWLWLIANANTLDDMEAPLSQADDDQLQQLTCSALPELSQMAANVLERRGIMERIEMLDIPVENELRMARDHNNAVPEEFFQIYPNPSTNYAIISSKEISIKFRHVEVFDMAGRKVEQLIWKENTNQFILNTMDWQSGVYLIRINDGTYHELTLMKE
jgi:hypothetical protein